VKQTRALITFVVVVAGIWIAVSGNGAVTGGILLMLGLACAGMSAFRRGLPAMRRRLTGWEGLDAFPSLLAAFAVFFAAVGNCNWHATQEALAAKERQRLETLAGLASRMPDLIAVVNAVEQAVDAGQLPDAQRRLQALEAHYGPLKGSELASRPDVQSGLERLSQGEAALRAAEERQAVDGAMQAMAMRPGSLPRLLALAKSRDALRKLHTTSDATATLRSDIEKSVTEAAHQLPALNQPLEVLGAKLGQNLGEGRADGLRPIGGVGEAEAFAQVPEGTCTGLYLGARTADASLSTEAVSRFLDIALGAAAAGTQLAAPTKKGSQTTKVAAGGATIRAGWFDQRLINLTVGDFQP